MTKFNDSLFTDDNIAKALELHAYYANQVSQIKTIENTTNMSSKFKSEIIREHQSVQDFLKSYFEAREDTGKIAVTTATDIIRRRAYLINELDEDGEKQEEEMIDLGLPFIHEQFNGGNLFPLSTFMSLFADSGVGKSDYIYRIANSLLMQDYKVMLCSFEFGEQRLSRLISPEELGGKDRLRESRLAGKMDNMFVNYHARDFDSIKLMIDTANMNGVRAVLIDSFGELELDSDGEYGLQKRISIMLNAKKNDYGMFIAIIGQTKSLEIDGNYTVRGGKDLVYKPDLSIHIKKVSAEDTSGDRIVHLFKNREEDINGKTIVTRYDFEKREPTFKHIYDGKLSDGTPVRTQSFPTSKKKCT